MKKRIELFINEIPSKLEELKMLLSVDNIKIDKFIYSSDEIDVIELYIKENYNKNQSLLDLFKIYLGEAIIERTDGYWTFHSVKSLISFGLFAITGIKSGKHKGYMPDYIPDFVIEYSIFEPDDEGLTISQKINQITKFSKKQMDIKNV
ncbi:MAG: hypothetical protein WAM46_13225 [Flavobacterium sp.]